MFDAFVGTRRRSEFAERICSASVETICEFVLLPFMDIYVAVIKERVVK